MKKFQILFIDRQIDSIKALFSSSVSDEVALFIACQFALESAYGSSRIAKTYHNISGMSRVFHRVTLDLCKSNKFASYSSDTNCLLDYFLWLSFNRFTKLELGSVSEFEHRLISCNYNSNASYLDAIHQIRFTYLKIKHYEEN